MRLHATELLELFTRHGFEQLPCAGESLMLRHPGDGRIFTLCAPPNLRLDRPLLVRILLDLRIMDADLGLGPAGFVDAINGSNPMPLHEQLATVEVRLIAAALERHGNVSKAAAALGVSRPTLYNKMQRLGLVNPRASKGQRRRTAACKKSGTWRERKPQTATELAAAPQGNQL